MTDALDLLLILPEIVLAVLGLVLLGLDLFFMRRREEGVERSSTLAMTAIVVVVGAALVHSWLLGPSSLIRDSFPQFFSDLLSRGTAMNGAFLVDGITLFFRVVLWVTAAMVIFLSSERRWGDHEGEYYSLLVLSLLGMTLMAAAGELISIYVALELTSISLYLLAAFDFRKRSVEAGLKYFLFGAFSSALLLYGLSLVYGFTGTTRLEGIFQSLQFATGNDPANLFRPENYGILLGIAFLVAGFGFKVALVPFHGWAPDVYEGAPTPITAFISTGSKVASFIVLVRVFQAALPLAAGSAAWGDMQGWAGLLAVLAVVTMTAGNLMALRQTNVKRLLAYSSIAHAGYMVIGVAINTGAGLEALFYYLVAYVLSNVGAFATVILVGRQLGGEELSDFAGLSKRSPRLAGAVTVLFFSLAGVPPLAGFFAKFRLFWATFQAGEGWWWLAVVGLVNSIVAFFYYLRVLKAVWFEQPADEEQEILFGDVSGMLLSMLVLLIIFLGVLPTVVLPRLGEAVRVIFAGF